MRLVSLELKGFKSFARETVLHFREDVIGVVGPNGSGKSNIVDAIRWVLGEQKKGELRLDKMSSVIFNGTKRRKPGSVAQVFLTFDNDRGTLRSDFKTVTIGRLLYRNGDSEYRLNGVTCRRKDVTELFIDTGVESNSYAIIALGMVDDILADKDNSRLRMLEQAAGISVYKHRRKEALARLERTGEDLDRLHDLLHEIESQLRVLDKQARRARKHGELKATYRARSLEFAHLSSRELDLERSKLSDELIRVEVLTEEQTGERDRIEAALSRLRDTQRTEDDYLAEQRRRLGSLQAELRATISQRDLAQQKRTYLLDKLTSVRERLTAAQIKRARLDERFRACAVRVAETENAQTAFAKTYNARREALYTEEARVAASADAGTEYTASIQRLNGDIATLERSLAVAESRRDGLRLESAARSRRVQQDARDREHLAAERQTAAQSVSALRSQLDEAERQATECLADQQDLRALLDELAPQLRDRRAEKQKHEHEAVLLRDALDKLSGSTEADRYLAYRHGWRTAYPILGELIDPDPDYRSAAEAVLSPVLGSFVVPDAATANEGLRVLAEARKPITSILFPPGDHGDKTNASLRDKWVVPPDARPLLGLVRVPEGYQSMLDVLLAAWFVVPNDTTAVIPPPGCHFVAVDGRRLWAAHYKRGGTVGKLLGQQTGRRQRLGELTRTVEDLASEIGALEKRSSEAQARLQELKSSADVAAPLKLREDLGRAERQESRAAAQLEAIVGRLNEREREGAAARASLTEVLAKADQLIAERHSLLSEREVLTASIDEAEAKRRLVAIELAASRTAFNEAKVTAVKLENATATAVRERDYVVQELEATERGMAHDVAALETDGAQAEGLGGQLAELDGRIAEGQRTRDEYERQLVARERDYYALRDEATDAERRLGALQRSLGDVHVLASGLRERKAEVEFKRDGLAERLRLEFGLDLAAAVAPNREVADDLDYVERELVRLKRRLDKFGEVNPLAIEAQDALAERHAGIAKQRDDILGAMTDLRETVAEIDATATAQLLAAFETVRGHFVEVFRHLFDEEDTADMLMVDPDNPLASKIEIVARPKGKRPQTISQLSGGEKTLTATAFLFALYLVKPAPFCIFDEVDAPLDDANVEKFNRIIKRFSRGSQFIVVTHNKLTMAAVDTIYGVFMSELGVSQVAPVDFRQFEHSDLAELVG